MDGKVHLGGEILTARNGALMMGSPATAVGTQARNAALSAAVSLTAPAGATGLLIQAFTQSVRFTLENTVPTATVGFQVSTTDGVVLIPVTPGQVIKVIEVAASASIEYLWVS